MLAMFWLTVMQAQTVISIPFQQYPPLKVVAPTLTVDLDNGADLLGGDLVVEGGDGRYAYLWTDGDGNELGHEATLHVNRAGDYFLRVSDGRQCQVSVKFTVKGTVGIEALTRHGLAVTLEGGILVMSYPTPPQQLRIVNAAGQLERHLVRLPEHGCTEDLTALPTGAYMVCIVMADGQAVIVKLNR